jgi:hypothetical protein
MFFRCCNNHSPRASCSRFLKNVLTQMIARLVGCFATSMKEETQYFSVVAAKVRALHQKFFAENEFWLSSTHKQLTYRINSPTTASGTLQGIMYHLRLHFPSSNVSWTAPSDLVSCQGRDILSTVVSAVALLPRLATTHCANLCKSSSRGMHLELPIWLGKSPPLSSLCCQICAACVALACQMPEATFSKRAGHEAVGRASPLE